MQAKSAEQLELEIAECCGTCIHWRQDEQEKRPASLRTMFSGNCKYKGETKNDDRCWWWAQAREDELGKWGY